MCWTTNSQYNKCILIGSIALVLLYCNKVNLTPLWKTLLIELIQYSVITIGFRVYTNVCHGKTSHIPWRNTPSDVSTLDKNEKMYCMTKSDSEICRTRMEIEWKVIDTVCVHIRCECAYKCLSIYSKRYCFHKRQLLLGNNFIFICIHVKSPNSGPHLSI